MTNIVIVGSSDFVIELAKRLERKENKIIVVVEDKEKALDISSSESGIIVINGNPLDPKILEELNLKECEVFVAADKREETNLLTCLYAKKEGVSKIFAKVVNKRTGKLLEEMSDIIPINFDESAASNVALKIEEPLVSELVLGSGKFEIVEKKTEFYPNLIGKRINKVKGNFFTTLAVYQDGEFHFLPNTVIKDGATLIVLREAGKRKEMKKALKELK